MRDRELLAALCAAVGFAPAAAWSTRLRQPDFPWERFVALAELKDEEEHREDGEDSQEGLLAFPEPVEGVESHYVSST